MSEGPLVDSEMPSSSLWSPSCLQKKKICLQNMSDGIKHLFQTDSNKTCQYLLQLCSDQHKFHLQMKARQNNQELQELGMRDGQMKWPLLLPHLHTYITYMHRAGEMANGMTMGISQT